MRKLILPKRRIHRICVEENDQTVIERYEDDKHRARMYSGLTVISGVMLPNFCNTDSDMYSGATNSSHSCDYIHSRVIGSLYTTLRKGGGEERGLTTEANNTVRPQPSFKRVRNTKRIGGGRKSRYLCGRRERAHRLIRESSNRKRTTNETLALQIPAIPWYYSSAVASVSPE